MPCKLSIIAIVFLSINTAAFSQVEQTKENSKSIHPNSRKDKRQPIFSLGDFKSDHLYVDDFKKGLNFTIADGYVINTISIYFAGAGFPNTIVATVTGNSTGAIKSLMDKLTIGSIVAFDNIKLKGKDGIKTFPGKKFTLY